MLPLVRQVVVVIPIVLLGTLLVQLVQSYAIPPLPRLYFCHFGAENLRDFRDGHLSDGLVSTGM